MAGCRVEGGVGAGANSPATAPAPAAQPPAAAPGNAGGGTAAGNADCPNPANHCLLDEQLYFVQKKPWEHGYVYAEVATQTTPADGAGVAQFLSKKSGQQMSSQYYQTTRPVTDVSELAVGQRIVMFHGNAKDRIYRAPETRTDALSKRWWTARITSVAPATSGAYVLVSGGYKIGTDNIRFPDGQPMDTAEVAGTEDAQFLTPNHWLMSMKPLKEGGYTYVYPAAAIAVPSPQTKNEGHFLNLNNGKQGWTQHAWATRPATQADLKVGNRIFMFHGNAKDKIYHGPRSRQEALSKRWWSAVITDDSTAFKGIVTVAGGYQIALDGIRVPR